MSRPRAERLRGCILSLSVDNHIDVWVFTETHPDVDPGSGYRIVTSSSPAPDRFGAERWVSIWARSDLSASPLDSADPERTACARFSFVGTADWYIYGTVLPWHGDKRCPPVIGKTAFETALAAQKSDWVQIQARHPEVRLIVTGDFNQDMLDNGHYYGSSIRRRALQDALKQTELECVTGGSEDPVVTQKEGHASVDHICISRNLRGRDTRPKVWPKTAQLRRGLSDHFGVVVSLNVASSTSD